MGEKFSPMIDPNHFLGRSPFDIPWHEMPATNVSKQEEKVVLDLSVPGFTKDDLEILIAGKTLTVKGEKPHRLKKTGIEYIVEEFSMDSFERKFRLSDEINAEHINAKCENGVLHIIFMEGKKTPKDKAHAIEVA
jgi:HSP20 family protein